MAARKNEAQSGTIKASNFRWVVLLMLFMLVFSMIYCYDNLFALQNQLQEAYDLSPIQYNMLYSIYGYVNVVLPLISGILIDYLGINTSSLFFYTLVVVGQSIWILGCIIGSYPVMVMGRGIFGCGTQPFHSSRKYLLGKYFIGKEYLFASGVTISASRCASAVASVVSALVYRCCGLITALSVGEILVIISFLFLIAFVLYDKSKNPRRSHSEKKPLLTATADIEAIDSGEERGFYFVEGIKAFDRRFWFLSMALVTFYASYMSFTNVQSAFLQSTYGIEYQTANDLAGIPFFIATFTAPLFGYFADRYGRKLLLLTIDAVLLIVSHCILGFSADHIDDDHLEIMPLIGLIGFGTAMSLGSALLWPMVLLVCETKYHATALGISSSIDNGGQATSFLIVGALTIGNGEERGQYRNVSLWLITLAVLMLIFTILLWCCDDELNKKPMEKVIAENTDGVDTEKDSVSMQSIDGRKNSSHSVPIDGSAQPDLT